MADPKVSPPAINLARANLCPTSDFRDYRARRQALRNNRSFLPSAPTPPPFWACYDLNPRHRTVPNTSANTISCTSAYQPNPPQLGKAAITAGLRFACTHGLFSAGALDRLDQQHDVFEIVSTNTVPIPAEKCVPKLKILSVAPALAEAMRRIHNGESVSALFHPADGGGVRTPDEG
jgi:hypothetical protein